jgi:hypothetical protein
MHGDDRDATPRTSLTGKRARPFVILKTASFLSAPFLRLREVDISLLDAMHFVSYDPVKLGERTVGWNLAALRDYKVW